MDKKALTFFSRAGSRLVNLNKAAKMSFACDIVQQVTPVVALKPDPQIRDRVTRNFGMECAVLLSDSGNTKEERNCHENSFHKKQRRP
jgi:hypothetical protein